MKRTFDDWFSENSSEHIMAVWGWKRSIFFAVTQGYSTRISYFDTLIREVNNMAKEVKNGSKSRNASKGTYESSKRTSWITCDIRNSEDKQAFNVFRKDVDGVLDCMVVIVDDGHDIIVKRDSSSGSVRAMLFCNTEDHPHAGLGLSANGSDAFTALAALVYKFAVKLRGSLITNGEDNDFDFG